MIIDILAQTALDFNKNMGFKKGKALTNDNFYCILGKVALLV